MNGYHRKNGYDLSSLGYYVCYTYFIGTTGQIVQTRPDTDRTMCTKNDDVNMHSLQIVLAGEFQHEEPTKAQLRSLSKLTDRLRKKYNIPVEHIIAHREASSTTCPGDMMMEKIQQMRVRLLGHRLAIKLY